MATFNKRLVIKGQGVPTHALMQQCRLTWTHANDNKDELLSCGLKQELLAEYKTRWTEVESGTGAQKDRRDTAAARARDEVDARHRAKSFKRRLWQAAKIELVEEDEEVTLENLRSGQIRNSTTRLVKYLKDVRPHVAKLDERLKPYFRGQSPLAELDQVCTDLENADTAQESTLDSAPAETRKLHENKGRLLELIELINGIARIAFDGQADKLALFNKDLLLRARGRGKASDEPDTEETIIDEAAMG